MLAARAQGEKNSFPEVNDAPQGANTVSATGLVCSHITSCCLTDSLSLVGSTHSLRILRRFISLASSTAFVWLVFDALLIFRSRSLATTQSALQCLDATKSPEGPQPQ